VSGGAAGYRIERARPDDAPALAAMGSASYADQFGPSMTEAELAGVLKDWFTEANYRAAIETDILLLARGTDAALWGYVRIGAPGPYPGIAPGPQPADRMVHGLYVAVGQQGRGIGRALMAAALALPEAKTAPALWIDVWAENTRAVSLYRSFGFEKVGTVDVVADGKVIGQDDVLVRRA